MSSMKKGWAGSSKVPFLVGCFALNPLSMAFYLTKTPLPSSPKLYRVVMARHQQRVTLTMQFEVPGESSELAFMIPVGSRVAQDSIQAVDQSLLTKLENYSAPRLVEMYDRDPCKTDNIAGRSPSSSNDRGQIMPLRAGTTVVAGDFEVTLVPAADVKDFSNWASGQGYTFEENLPTQVQAYSKEGYRFLLAKVRVVPRPGAPILLSAVAATYDQNKPTLPLRFFQTKNSDPVDMQVYLLTARGRVEPTSSKQVRVPTGMRIPSYVREEFPALYTSILGRARVSEKKGSVFLEFASNAMKCDFCAGNPLSKGELKAIGTTWLDADQRAVYIKRRAVPLEAFLTRLRVRAPKLDEDLVLRETADSDGYQVRYTLSIPWGRTISCGAAGRYKERITRRRNEEALALASLTGWPLSEIDKKMGNIQDDSNRRGRWYEQLRQ